MTTPSHWSSRGIAETFTKPTKLLEIRSENDIELHVTEVEKTGNQIEIGENENELSDFDTNENKIIDELKNAEYNDLEEMVFRKELTYGQIEKALDVKFIPASSIRYTLFPDVYEISDIKLMLKSLLPDDVKVDSTSDDMRLKASLTTNKTIKFTKRSFSIQ